MVNFSSNNKYIGLSLGMGLVDVSCVALFNNSFLLNYHIE